MRRPPKIQDICRSDQEGCHKGKTGSEDRSKEGSGKNCQEFSETEGGKSRKPADKLEKKATAKKAAAKPKVKKGINISRCKDRGQTPNQGEEK